MRPRKPDYRLVVKKKDAKYWSQIGVGWENEFGINITLNPCTTLTDRDDIYISLRKYDQRDAPGEPPPPADVPF